MSLVLACRTQFSVSKANRFINGGTNFIGLKSLSAYFSSASSSQKDYHFSSQADAIFLSDDKFPNNEFIYKKGISFANTLLRFGFPRSQFNYFLERNHFFLMNSNLKDIEQSLCLLLSFKIPKPYLISLVYDCPSVLEFEFLRKWKMIFSKFSLCSISPEMVRSVLQYSMRFQVDPFQFSRAIMNLKDLGFNDATVTRVLEDFPDVVSMDQQEIFRRIEFFMAIGLDKVNIDRIFHLYPKVLGFEVENRLVRLKSELMDLGFCQNDIAKEIIREPRIMGMELGELSRCLQLLRSLRCREPIKQKIFSEGEVKAGFELKQRIDCLCKHGLIRRDAFKILYKEPRLIIYETDKIEKKIDFLVNKMKFSVDSLVEEGSEYLGMNFEKQIVPRFKVIDYLRSRNGIKFHLGLREIFKPSRVRFYNIFVKPYPECEKMFGRLSGDVQVKRQHPEGLWRIFKPHSFPESLEDTKNMKSFMDSLV